MWRNNIIDITQRQNKANANLHLCEAQPCRGPCAQQCLWPFGAKARNLLSSPHYLCLFLPHLSREDSMCARERHWQRKGEPSFSLTVDPCLPPASNPTVISHTDLFVCRDSCSFLSPPLSLLFNFSYLMRRSRVRGGVETRSGG